MPKGLRGFQKNNTYGVLNTTTHFKKGFIPWNRGRKEVRAETLRRQRVSHLDKKQSAETVAKRTHTGDKSPNWRGGITPLNKMMRKSVEYRLWREAVFARDNWVCQKCTGRGCFLHPHHILNFSRYPELRFAIDNGYTLCRKCHMAFHNKYGRSNNTKEQLNEYLNQI
jgi:hypothetical protein